MTRKFFISVGHGGKDPGAVFNGIKEFDEVKNIVAQALDLLKHQKLLETEIVEVPAELPVGEAVNWINERSTNPGRDLAVEFHLNSNQGTPGTGVETWYGNFALGEELHEGIVAILDLNNRGLKDGMGFWFNQMTKPASALVELGFLNNPQDLEVIRKKGAEAIARAVVMASGNTYLVASPILPPAPLPVENNSEAPKENEASFSKHFLAEFIRLIVKILSFLKQNP